MAARPRRQPSRKTYSGRIASKLVQLMDRRRWTVDDTATRLSVASGMDVKPQTLRSYLRGDRAVPADLYPAIAKIFGFARVPNWLPPK